MRVLSVVGARPQFVKLAPVAQALTAAGVDHRIVHTGQHYDDRLSQAFFDDLTIPAPDVNLEVGSSGHGAQTGDMMIRLEPVLADLRPDWVLVYGDTNSTLAAAVVAVKLHQRLAHLEAGLRSFNRRMPEEHNRVLTDHAADLLLAPTEVAMDHLAAEGLAGRSVLVGDVMTDVCLRVAADSPEPELPTGVRADRPFILATIHRAENTDDPDRLKRIIVGLQQQQLPVVLAAHPRLISRAAAHGVPLDSGAVRLVAPLGYPQMIASLKAAAGAVTDSGGLQKEAYLVGTPCTTVRTETEWLETVAEGWNALDPDADRPDTWLRPAPPDAGPRDAYGTGDAAGKVVAAILEAGTGAR